MTTGNAVLLSNDSKGSYHNYCETPPFRPNNLSYHQLGSSTASATVEQQRDGKIQSNDATSRKSIGWQFVPLLQHHYRCEMRNTDWGYYTPILLLPMSQSKYATLSSSPSKPEGKKKYYSKYFLHSNKWQCQYYYYYDCSGKSFCCGWGATWSLHYQ